MSRFKFNNPLKQLGLFEHGNQPLSLPTPPPDDDPAWDDRHDDMTMAADDALSATVQEPLIEGMTTEDADQAVDAWLRLIAGEDPYYSAGL